MPCDEIDFGSILKHGERGLRDDLGEVHHSEAYSSPCTSSPRQFTYRRRDVAECFRRSPAELPPEDISRSCHAKKLLGRSSLKRRLHHRGHAVSADTGTSFSSRTRAISSGNQRPTIHIAVVAWKSWFHRWATP